MAGLRRTLQTPILTHEEPFDLILARARNEEWPRLESSSHDLKTFSNVRQARSIRVSGLRWMHRDRFKAETIVEDMSGEFAVGDASKAL
jgi:hypothetical protein